MHCSPATRRPEAAFCKCTTMRVAQLLLAAQAARALVDVEWYGYSS